MPDRLTPSEALAEIKRRYDGRSETPSVSPETLKLPTLMLFDHVAAALARPTPGEEIGKIAYEAAVTLHNMRFPPALQSTVDLIRGAIEAALAAQPASPPPTQGWEEALKWLSWLCDCCYSPENKRDGRDHLTTLRSHLSGREARGWTPLLASIKTRWVWVTHRPVYNPHSPENPGPRCKPFLQHRAAILSENAIDWLYHPVEEPTQPPTSEMSGA